MDTLSISATARAYPRLPYREIKEDILGASYVLSLAFVGEQRAREVNRAVRKKDYVPNVLSIPLEKKYGEIIITPVRARKEARHYNLSPRGYIAFLYIHGLLHLAGHDHGAKMERLEQRYLAKYGIR